MKKLFVLALAGIFSLNFLVAQNSTPATPQTSNDKKEVKQENKSEKKVANPEGMKKGHKPRNHAAGKDSKGEKKEVKDNNTEKKEAK